MDIFIASSQKRHKKMVQNLQNKLYPIKIHFIRNSEKLVSLCKKCKIPKKIFFPHWSTIIPQKVFKFNECIIFHMTDVPYGRGGSPLQNLIVRGHKNTKITALRCARKLDAGPVYIKRKLYLHGDARSILQRADKIIENMIFRLTINPINPKPQKGKPVFFLRRKPEEGNLLKCKNIATVFNYIRMLDADGYPKAFIKSKKIIFEFKKALLKNKKIRATVNIYSFSK